MSRLGFLGVLAAAFWISPLCAGEIDRWRPYVDEASHRSGVPAAWIERVLEAESGGRTRSGGAPIVSRAGAMGLMQVMPGTWSAMRERLGLGADPHDPHDNILAGSFYLRPMYERFGYPGLFAAYNAGPARYAEHLETGRALPRETRAYVAMVAGRGDFLGQPARTREPARGTASRIFFRLSSTVPAPAGTSSEQ